MSKLDEKKAQLEELKTYRNFALTSLLALIAFVFTKIESNAWILGLSALAIVGLGIGIFILQIKIQKLIKEIGEL